MPLFDSDPNVEGAQQTGDAFNDRPVAIGGPDASGNLRPVSAPADGESVTGARGLGIFGKTAAALFRWLLVEDSGKLVVASTPPQPPPGTTEFVLSQNEANLVVGNGGDVASPHDTDSAVIGSGIDLVIQSFELGTEGDPTEAGSMVEIFWVEGAGATEHLVTRALTDGATRPLPKPDINKARDGTAMTGNGTNTFLRVRRTRLSNAGKIIDFEVRGYTE